MVEAVKAAKDIGEVVVISIASGAVGAVVISQVYEAAQSLDRSQKCEAVVLHRRALARC